MPDIPYDELRRNEILRGLAMRTLHRHPLAHDDSCSPIAKEARQRRRQVVAFKTEYFPDLHKLRLRRRIDDLVRDLRKQVGRTPLKDTMTYRQEAQQHTARKNNNIPPGRQQHTARTLRAYRQNANNILPGSQTHASAILAGFDGRGI